MSQEDTAYAAGSEEALVIESTSARETRMWGRRLGSLLVGGELIGLTGELGTGKTCFIKGVARGLGLCEADILSPTFTMIQEHRGRLPLFHVDLYRLEAPGLDDLGLREYLFSPAVAAVEWFERLREAMQLDFLAVRIGYAGANCRRIRLEATGARHAPIVAMLRRRFA